MNFLECCRKFIGLDTTPGSGTHGLARFVKEYGESLGFQVEIHESSPATPDAVNVVMRSGASVGQETLMLQAHLDTPDPGPYRLWHETGENPFNATISNGRLYGLGAAAPKMDFLCKIRAASHFVKQSLNKSFVLVGTHGYEQGMTGAVKLIRRKIVKPERALVGEPTSCRLNHASPGVAVVEIVVPLSSVEREYRHRHNETESASSQSRFFYGKSAHSSQPELGENAIMKMLEFLCQLPDGIAVLELDGGTSQGTVPASALLEFDVVGNLTDTVLPKLRMVVEALRKVEADLKEFRQEGYVPDVSTLNLGVIKAYEDHIRLEGSCLILPSVPSHLTERWMNDLAERCQAAGATFRIMENRAAFLTRDSSPFVELCQQGLIESGLNPALDRLSHSSEASVFTRLGVECLAFGPGQSLGNVRAPNENVLLSELDSAVSFYQNLLKRYGL